MLLLNSGATRVTFGDAFKKKFLEGFSVDLDLGAIAMTMLVVLAIAVFIFFVYKKANTSVMYMKSFNISMASISVITAILIMAISSNVVLSLGMVGALSIVRFRTAIKDPMDMLFLFWSISMGIVTGAGFFWLAILSSAVIGAGLILCGHIPEKARPYILVVNYEEEDTENFIFRSVKEVSKKYKVKSKNITSGNIELTLEVGTIPKPSSFVNRLNDNEGIKHVVLVSYNGDYSF